MRSPLQLLSLSPIQSLMMINSLSLQCLDLILKLDALLFFFLFLLMRPLQNPFGFLLVKGKFLLFLLVVFVDLGVFHLEL